MKRALGALTISLSFLLATRVSAAPEAATGADAHGLDPAILIGIAVMLVIAKLGGELFERLQQPAVLGELCAGIMLGNLVIFGFTRAEQLKTNETIAALAEFG